MASERKKLLMQRTVLEKNLSEYRRALRIHERALMGHIKANWGLLLFMLVPVCWIGWKLTREKQITSVLNPVLKIGAMALVNQAKEYILSSKV